ncbi:MAG: sulfotransferase family 2 domain-containing protein [Opitutaceae bacterium]
MSQDPSTLIFHHIPKAAGSVFSSSLAVYFPESAVFRMDYVETNQERIDFIAGLTEKERKRYRLILGHMPFGVHRLLAQQSAYYAFVRHPVKRVLSLCRFICEREHHYLNSKLKEAGSVAAFVRSGCTTETHNEMVRYFCYPEQIDESEPVGPQHLKFAIENIETHFPSVGLSENYDASVVIFSKLYGMSAPFYIRRNQSKGASVVLTDEDKEAVREANTWDMELYEYLQERFQKQLDASLEEDPDAVSRFQKANSSYGRFIYTLRGGTRKVLRALRRKS